MKLGEVDINQAHGLRLSEELYFDDKIFPKNHILNSNDIDFLKQQGFKNIFGAKAEDGDIDFDTALGIIAAKISGQNSGFRIDKRGFCEIAAVANGLFDVSAERINKFNRFSSYFILNTIPPYSQVKKGDIIARLEILPPIIPQEIVDDLIFLLSGNESLLSVRELSQQNAALLYTQFYNDENEQERFAETVDKLTSSYKNFNINFSFEQSVRHTVEDIASGLETLLKSSAEIIFIVKGQHNCAPEDITASAITSIADTIICSNIPLFGGSDLIIATKKHKKIICLPYNYAYLDAALLNNFIKLAIIKPKIQAFDFRITENAFISGISHIKDISSLIRPNKQNRKNAASIAAVILAAGQSKRIGKNKLLADIHGNPLILRAIEAAIHSEASPIFVVTGYQAEKLEAELENFDINIIYNPNFRMGIKTSINIGLKSVPDFCDGALLIPGDMPNLTPQLINNMIAKFQKKTQKQLIVTDKQGVKSNPVLWSKALYNTADLVAENADIRPVFMEHADYTTFVKATDTELLDINFQNDLDMLLKV